MPLVMGVASLAAATRVEVRDADDGRLVATGTANHPGVPAHGGMAEQQAEAWWDGFADAVAAAGVRTDVAGLAVSAQRGALVLVDGAGATLGAASLRTDTRAASIAAELVARLGADRLARATGQLPRADTPLARLVWRVGADPHIVDQVDAVLGAADAITARLTLRRVTDRSSASATGWWDPVAGRWRADLLDRAVRPGPVGGWPATLPTVLRPVEAADWVSATVHGAVGLRGRPLVAAGSTDLAARALAAAIAPGAAAALLDDDDPVVVAGAATPAADPSGQVVGLADATGNHLPTVAIAPLGSSLDGIARLLGTDVGGVATRAATHAASAGGRPPNAVVLPGRTGPRSARPPGRPGMVIGLDGATSAGELAWAGLLGAAAEILEALGLLAGVGGGEPEGGRLVLAGATARRPGFAAAVADLAGREVVVARYGGPATGACVQATAALRETNPLDVARAWGLDAGEVVDPPGLLDAAGYLALHASARDELRASTSTTS